jgi:hypothetical protein
MCDRWPIQLFNYNRDCSIGISKLFVYYAECLIAGTYNYLIAIVIAESVHPNYLFVMLNVRSLAYIII